MSDPAPVTVRPQRSPRRPWWLLLGVVAGLVAAIALGYAAFTLLTPASTPALVELPAQSELGRRWGSYLLEREWGTPREAVGDDGWGMTWSDAISDEYRYGADGIAGVTDENGEFRLSWAFWTGTEQHVTERFKGYNNTQGQAGEQITDDRIFHENGPTHAYHRMTYLYPREMPWFSIELESARSSESALTMVATVTNTTTETRSIDVVFRAALAPGQVVEPLPDGLLLPGDATVVAVVGQTPTDWQISPDKGALDANLRGEGLTGDSGGSHGSLAYRLEIPAGSEGVIRIGVAEAAIADSPDAGAQATGAAADVLELSDDIVAARREEADGLFRTQVAEHEPLYRQALMSLMWNESLYRWDGASGVDPDWAGRVDARDVLIMPDKWEYPWLASWDAAYHAVTASLVDPEVAQDQLRFVLSDRWQQPGGHIPCSEWTMDDECPPIFAWAAWRVFEESGDAEFLAEIYPSLQRSYDYWWAERQVGEALFSAGTLGMDNLPRAAPGSPQVDASAWMALFARDMARIASELDDQSTSERYWIDRGRIQEQINARLWDESSAFYYDLTPTGEFVAEKSYAGLIPLIAGVVPPERLPPILGALRDESQFLSTGGVRSLSADSPFYRPATAGSGVNSNWRGPVWVPINYMLVEALADVDPSLASEVRTRVVTNVETDWERTSRLHEFFDGDTGEGLGADEHAGWTALVANLIREGWPAPDAE